jgi:protein-S-isoprenylcysteine O-methyltransferase Ste14
MTSDIKMIEGHRLVKDGPYSYVRHPLILCAMIEAVGLALIPNSYYTLLIALFGFVPFMVFRAYLEERMLIEEFGDEYRKYKKEVFSFFPIKKVKR